MNIKDLINASPQNEYKRLNKYLSQNNSGDEQTSSRLKLSMILQRLSKP